MTIDQLLTRPFNRVFLLVIGLLVLNQAVAQRSLTVKTIVIDAGHGGKDPGAVGKKAKEKDIVLDVALKLGGYINEHLPDVKVVYTRDKDVFVPLNERATIANKNNADLFVSIHVNAISSSSTYGAESFTLGLHRTDDNLAVAMKENAVIVMEDNYKAKYEGFDPNSSESYIIFELMQDVYFGQSIYAASLVQEQFKTRVGRRDRGVKQAGFLVLREVAMPSVLVELGFISNPMEEKFLDSEEGRTYMASALFRAIRDYKTDFDAKSASNDSMSPNATIVSADVAPVVFRIQVASSRRQINAGTNIYKDFDEVWEYKEGDVYKYTTGECADYTEVLKLLEQVKSKVKDAFIVAFNEKHEKISMNEARALLGK